MKLDLTKLREADKKGDMSSFASYVGKNYDSTKDYWKFVSKKVIFDGDTAVKDADGRIIHDDGTMEGGLTFLGYSESEAKQILRDHDLINKKLKVSTDKKEALTQQGYNLGAPFLKLVYVDGDGTSIKQDGQIYGYAVDGDTTELWGEDLETDSKAELLGKNDSLEMEYKDYRGIEGRVIIVEPGVYSFDKLADHASKNMLEMQLDRQYKEQTRVRVGNKIGDVSTVLSLGFNMTAAGSLSAGLLPIAEGATYGAFVFDALSMAGYALAGNWNQFEISTLSATADFVPFVAGSLKIGKTVVKYNHPAARFYNTINGQFISNSVGSGTYMRRVWTSIGIDTLGTSSFINDMAGSDYGR